MGMGKGRSRGRGRSRDGAGEGPLLHRPGLVDSGWTLPPGLFLVKQKHRPQFHSPLLIPPSWSHLYVSKFMVQVVSRFDLAVDSVPSPPPLSCLDLPKCQSPRRAGLPSSPPHTPTFQWAAAQTCTHYTHTHTCTLHTHVHMHALHIHTCARTLHMHVDAHLHTAHTHVHAHSPSASWETAGQGRWRLRWGFLSRGLASSSSPSFQPGRWHFALLAPGGPDVLSPLSSTWSGLSPSPHRAHPHALCTAWLNGRRGSQRTGQGPPSGLVPHCRQPLL